MRDWILQVEDFSPLCDDENTENVKLGAASWATLMQESPVDGEKPYRRGKRFINELLSDYPGTVRKYKQIGNALLRSIHGEVVDGKVKLRLDPLHDMFKGTPLFREYQYYFKYRDTVVLRYMMSFLWWCRKAEYVDPALEAESLAAWKAHEILMQELEFTKVDHVLEDLNMILEKSGFNDAFRKENIVFRHGPGTVAEGSFTQSKMKHALMVPNDNLAWVLDQVPAHATTEGRRIQMAPLVYEVAAVSLSLPDDCEPAKVPYSPYSSNDVAGLVRPSPYRELCIPDQIVWDTALMVAPIHALDVDELLFVDKDVDSKRVINRGPATYQFMQQGVHSALVRAIEYSKIGKWVKIHDQSHNRNGARRAAESLGLSTIDLKGASDSIHEYVISKVFRGLVRELLFKTRVDKVLLPDGETWQIKKFAPMGSATCFDIQSIFFLLIVWLVDHLSHSGVNLRDYLDSGRRIVLDNTKVRDLGPDLGVYGDDIICARKQTADVMTLLRTLGLTVNEGKSFYGDLAVAESCGGFYVFDEQTERVEDFAPTLFKVKGLIEGTQKSILSKIDLANRLYDLGYFKVRNLILRTIPATHFTYVDPETSPYWRYPWVVRGKESNYSKRRYRLNETLQRFEVQICRPVMPPQLNSLVFQDEKGYWERPEPGIDTDPGGLDNPLNLWRAENASRDDAESRYRLGLWYAGPSNTQGPGHDPLDEIASSKWRWRWTPIA